MSQHVASKRLTAPDIAQRKGVGERLIEKHGKAVLQAVKRGVDLPKDQWPRRPDGHLAMGRAPVDLAALIRAGEKA